MAATFDDGKDEGALRTIGELGDALGIKAHVLRYWEAQFPQLQPLKRSGGRRYYRPEDVALVKEIDRLVHKEGYTLRGAKAALKGFDPATAAKPEQVRVDESGPLVAAAEPPAPRELDLGSPREQPQPARVPHDIVSRLKAIRSALAEAIGA